VERVLHVHAKGVKIKKFLDLDVVTMHLLQKRFMKKYLCWYAYREPYILHDTIIEMMIESTSNSSNMHEVVDDNSNPYMNMVMDAMKINQCHADQCLMVDEKPNANTTTFFYLLKDFDEPL
jgi:hypothetical protein